MRRADRLGIALIVAVLATSFALGRGEIGNLLETASRQAQASLSAQSTVASESHTPQPELERPASGFGHLGDPPEARYVYPHIVMREAGTPRKAAHRFKFEGRTYAITLSVDSEMYRAAARANRSITEKNGESTDERLSDYYRFIAQDPVQAPLIADAAMKLRTLANRRKLDRDRYAELIARYVQTMPYDFKSYEARTAPVRFPVQTLVDRTGDCDEKSILLAALLAHEGYDVALLHFEAEKHMAVGIRGPGDHYKESGYLFLESTSPAYLSEVPDRFINGITLESEALAIPIGSGDRSYGAANDVARIVRVREAAHNAAKTFYDEASSQSLTPQEAASANSRIDVANQAQYKLSTIEGHEGERLDRVPAIQWIQKNCWWE